MAAPIPKILSQTINNIYQYFGVSDTGLDHNSVFKEPRISRQSPNKCDLCFPLVHRTGCEPYVPAVLIFPEHKNFEIKINIEQVKRELPKVSERWILPVKSCEATESSLCISLDRKKSFKNSVLKVLSENSTDVSLDSSHMIEITKDSALEDSSSLDLTQLRTILAFRSLVNIYRILGFAVKEKCCKDLQVPSFKFHLCHKSLCSEKGSEEMLIHCGAVLNLATGLKASDVSASDYYRLKELCFENAAHGRINPQDSIHQTATLSEAEVIAELLGVKLHDHVSVNLSVDPESNAGARGATFILYNHVRLKCIRKKFEQEVDLKSYPQLPPIKAVDFGLLTQNEEWELLLLILQFPHWIVNCVSPRGKISLHPVLVGLDKLCRIFSVYYRRVRILTEPRPHLLPVMYARLYLLKCLEQILGIGLSIFNVKPLDHM